MLVYLIIALLFTLVSVWLLIETIRKKWEGLYAKGLLFSSLLAVMGWIMVLIRHLSNR